MLCLFYMLLLCLVCISLVGKPYHWPSLDCCSICLYFLSPPMVRNLKSPDLLGSLNCNCDLVAHSSLPMDPFAHGDTIPMYFLLCMKYILIFQSLMRFFTYFWRYFIILVERFMDIFMIQQLHIMHILLNLLMLFGKEFAEISFPWLIILLD